MDLFLCVHIPVVFKLETILGDPGAVSWVDKMSVVKVYFKIEASPWALTLIEPVPEAVELPASDWPEKFFSGQSAKRSSRVTLCFLTRRSFFVIDRRSCVARATEIFTLQKG